MNFLLYIHSTVNALKVLMKSNNIAGGVSLSVLQFICPTVFFQLIHAIMLFAIIQSLYMEPVQCTFAFIQIMSTKKAKKK